MQTVVIIFTNQYTSFLYFIKHKNNSNVTGWRNYNYSSKLIKLIIKK